MRWSVFFMILLSGCATKPVSTFHTHNSLQIQLSRKNNSVYTLVDGSNYKISQSTGENGTLNFSIPDRVNAFGCFYILNDEGENLFENNPYFSLPLISQYRKTYTIINNIENKKNEYRRSENRYRDKNASAWERLNANRAFKDNTCYTPPQKLLPQEPNTKCDTETECREEGSAICFSRFFGTEGCGIALREINVPGILSAPGCAAAAAELASEKYDMDDAFVDFLHGLADDVADNLMDSESWWDKAWSVVVKLGNYSVKIDKANQCTNSFVEYYYGPKRRWLADVNRIIREPMEVRDECISNINEVNDYVSQINNLVERHREASRELELVNLKYEKLLKEKKPISYCN